MVDGKKRVYKMSEEEEERTEEAIERIKSDISCCIYDCGDDILKLIKEAREEGANEEDITDIIEGTLFELGELTEKIAKKIK